MFTQADRDQLDALGISAAEAERQMHLFEQPPPPARLVRPCTAGDGIARLDEAQQRAALAAWTGAAADGRLLKFVPASGAASRMFKALLGVRQSPGGADRAALERRAGADADARETLQFADRLPQFAFYAALRDALAAGGADLEALRGRGDLAPILDALLTDAGLDYAALPKGLLLFHRYTADARTAFEEHLVEGAACARDGEGRVRLHLTVSPEHRDGFERLFAARRASYERDGVRYTIELSTQQRSTDTLAVDADNRPFRGEDGQLLLRPGGHGALIENLNQLRGDLAFIKNIDNIQTDGGRPSALEWLRLLIGHLVVLQGALFAHLKALHAPPVSREALAAARDFARATLGAELGEDAAPDAKKVIAALDRPLRVCGVVRNSGEPGGGPFWVRSASGLVSKQIVESAEVDEQDAVQRDVFAASTHFNPVLLACGLRDWRGQPFDLRQFVEPDAVFIARKSHAGRALKALERPGLWNGAMARWHTVFVEVPDATFTPVKTVNDLLRPAHQGPG